jgi:hypothetical protein
VKSWISVIFAVIFLASIVVFNIRQPKAPLPQPRITPEVSPTETPLPTLSTTDCQLASLLGTVTFEPAAGNIYGTAKLTNISKEFCMISLNKNLQLTYLPTIKNINVVYTGTPSAASYKLFPNSSVYALIHMPNGPQCQSPLHQAQGSLSYQINTSQTLNFTSQNQPDFMINVCTDISDITTIEISSFSPRPLP